VYTEWSARGAQFLTPPKQHQYEIRCYIRDPDGHLIEVGQTTDPDGDWTPPQWLSSTAAGSPSECQVQQRVRQFAIGGPAPTALDAAAISPRSVFSAAT
jgi:hypothetical protein